MSAPFYLLPGWSLGCGPLRPLAEAIGARLLDLPGYGERPASDDFAASVAAYAVELPDGATLAGWSLGALLALAVAAHAPEKVGRLVLLAGTASFVQRPGWPQAMAPEVLAGFADAVAADPEALRSRFVTLFNRGDAVARPTTRALLDAADPCPSAEVLRQGLDWLRDVDLRDCLAAVRAPTLLLHGAADPLMPAAAAQALAEALPNARLMLLEGAAHAPFVSQPEAVVAALREFLNGA